MKIVYDPYAEAYLITLEESVFYFDTIDIVDAREKFIKQLTILFNNTVCEKLTD